MHTLSVLVYNQAGVLSRVVGLFSRRAYNIETLAVGKTHTDDSRITIELNCENENTLDQVIQQLLKLPCVRTVAVLDQKDSIRRELILVKVKTDVSNRSSIMEMASVFRARIIDVSRDSLTVELTGESDKIDALLEVMRDFEIMEIVRTGAVALHRGIHTIEQYVTNDFEEED